MVTHNRVCCLCYILVTIQYAQSLLNDAEQLAYSNPHQLVIKQYDQNAKLLANNVESLNGRGGTVLKYII